MVLSIDKKRIEELLASYGGYSVIGSALMQQPMVEPEGAICIYGTTYPVSPDIEKAKQHLISLREKIGENLLNEEQLRERLDAIRGPE